MYWIVKHKKSFVITAFLSAMAAVTLILYLRDKGTIESIEKWQLGLFVLPWVTFASSSLPLMFLSLFRTNKFGSATIIFKAFYWVLVSGFIAIIGGIYVSFVF